MKTKECVAMILAGGQGSRLGILTKNIAKPAVAFGGKYRIIDFPLSNCIHSGIDTVGVLTQYQPLELNTYIGSGQPWDLDRNNGGVFVLPPFVTSDKEEWYKGTANAIYQNIAFIEQWNTKYVAVLSGDHIYKMDYSKMLQFHKTNDADATIAVIEVPWDEASRFGIMNADSTGRVTEFEEKPQNPKSNLASMGVYIFTWSTLKKFLIADENNQKSEKDFGKNVIPQMLISGQNMFAYRFDNYWKDVGTVESLWEANMELLDDEPAFNLNDPNWTIFSRNPVKPPHYLTKTAQVKNSFITEGCSIGGRIENSVIFESVMVEEGAHVKDSIIFPGTKIGRDAVIEKAIVASNCIICDDAQIGVDDESGELSFKSKMCESGISLIGPNIIIDKGIKIAKNSMVERNIINDEQEKVFTGTENSGVKSQGKTAAATA